MRRLKNCKTLALCLLFILDITALGNQSLTIKDDMGHTHVLGDPPQRIISLAPNVTEILFALGLENKIIGVTRYCNYPKQAQTKNLIGGLVDPDLEKIIDLRPDLIIAFRGNPLSVVHRLKDLDLPVFVLEEGTTLESVFDLILKIGQITRKEKAAESLIIPLRENLNKIVQSLKSVETRPKVFFNLYGKGLWTCGKKCFLNDLVLKAKGVNAAGGIPRAWFSYNREELIHQNPEYIVVIGKSNSDFLEVKTWFTKEAHLESILAVQKGNIYFLNEDLITRPGPRLFQAFDQLVRILHPSILKDGQ
ncbi:MAG: ABC transporter substrate-binding protein [Candidatus Aminicenantes bacterium]|nr:MAG: ABC transporter substrate-binding protein [Candidatus Aminicenantes bacterium]